MLIRKANIIDADAISRVLSVLAEKFIIPDFGSEGRQRLLASMSRAIIAENINGGFRYHVAESQNDIVGVVGTSDDSHVYHLFVAESRQGRGLARRLWQTAMQDCLLRGNPGVFTVNSSLKAQPVYERFGFTAQSGPVTKDGVIFVPMRLEVSPADR